MPPRSMASRSSTSETSLARPASFPRQRLGQLLDRFLAEARAPLAQDVGDPGDDGHGAPDLMRHHRHEVAPDLVEVSQIVGRLHRFVVHARVMEPDRHLARGPFDESDVRLVPMAWQSIVERDDAEQFVSPLERGRERGPTVGVHQCIRIGRGERDRPGSRRSTMSSLIRVERVAAARLEIGSPALGACGETRDGWSIPLGRDRPEELGTRCRDESDVAAFHAGGASQLLHGSRQHHDPVPASSGPRWTACRGERSARPSSALRRRAARSRSRSRRDVRARWRGPRRRPRSEPRAAEASRGRCRRGPRPEWMIGTPRKASIDGSTLGAETERSLADRVGAHDLLVVEHRPRSGLRFSVPDGARRALPPRDRCARASRRSSIRPGWRRRPRARRTAPSSAGRWSPARDPCPCVESIERRSPRRSSRAATHALPASSPPRRPPAVPLTPLAAGRGRPLRPPSLC